MSVDTVSFKVNGTDYTVNGSRADERLVNFLHKTVGSLGTHVTCYEGGCGACTVLVSIPINGGSIGEKKTFSINSCLASLYGCDGWEITTIEGLGNKSDGYNLLQQQLTDYNGTQCGFCSPGMVMKMQGLMQSKPNWTVSDVEAQFDGNICRCTGYRPILDAFKSIIPADIQKSSSCCKGNDCCKKSKSKTTNAIITRKKNPKKVIVIDGTTWYQPTTLLEMQSIMQGLGSDYRIVVGNTGEALYDDGPYSAFVNTLLIPEFYAISTTSSSGSFGLNLSIAEMMSQFDSLSTSFPTNFSYLTEINRIWQKVANSSVRNLGSVGGNLVLRTMHHEFPSDIFITLLAAGATVTIANSDGSSTSGVTMETLIGMDLIGTKAVLQSLEIAPLPTNSVYRIFKVMPRNANSRTFVSGAFSMQVDSTSGQTINGSPIMAFTGISSTFIRATNAESYLSGKDLSNPAVLQVALTFLHDELNPDVDPAQSSVEFRTAVAQNIFYQYALGICADTVSTGYKSGADNLVRPLSSGVQTLNLNTDKYPLGEPLAKYEGLLQCAGEAEYVKTMKPIDGELVGIFVTSTEANADIVSIDPTVALAMDGVIAFFSANDIPGENKIVAISFPVYNEELFASTHVSYYGQSIGLIVATDKEIANAAAQAVTVTYTNILTPILTIEDALTAGNTDTLPGFEYIVGDVESAFLASDIIITGSMKRGSQYHFYMETQVCLAVPTEDGLDIYASSQWQQETQAAIAQVTGLANYQINVSNRRCGGAFGGKIDRCNFNSTASALAANILQKPVRVDLDLTTNMSMIGWRDPYLCTYKVGINTEGVLNAVQATLTCDTGHVAVDATVYLATFAMRSCYACPNWDVIPQVVLTNTSSNTWFRAPGAAASIATMENIMDHIAVTVNKDPLDVRQLNTISIFNSREINLKNQSSSPSTASGLKASVAIDLKSSNTSNKPIGPKGSPIHPPILPLSSKTINSMIDELVISSDFYARKAVVVQFNLDNRWKKKGIALMPILWDYLAQSVYGFSVMMSVYALDGTVIIQHAGIEIGQGMNTKIAQVAAYTLGCDYSKIKIKPTNTLTAANSKATGGDSGYNFNMHCIQQCAINLAARVNAIALPTWEERVAEAFAQGLSLTEYYWNGPDEVNSYGVEATCCTEIELDVLTGQFQITRADILQDLGQSPSPLIDLGQIEGGFVMGLGLHTTEKVLYDPITGQKLTNSTWLYKPPSVLDIPIDFRVSFLQNSSNPNGVLDSRVSSKPPVCLGYSVVMALREAITSAREDSGTSGWFEMDSPLTVDNIQTLCLVDQETLNYGNS